MESLKKFVHIDFKGAPIRLEYLKEVLKLLKKHGMDGVLLEYEDMFPYDGRLSGLARPDAFSKISLEEFLSFCKSQEITVIPLVQTFGHLEFVLKHEKYRSLRENYRYPMTICPSLDESISLIEEMIDQIITSHPDSELIHIGADEVFDFNVCQSCKVRDLDKPRLFLEHIMKVASCIMKKNRQAIMWDDMLRDIDSNLIRSCHLSDYVEPMIWNYTPLLTLEDDYFNSVLSLFPRVWAASAYKGANGAVQQIVNTSVYVKNNQSWVSRINKTAAVGAPHGGGRFVGIVLTGWSRFDHFATLCELFPASIPCLTLCLQILTSGTFTAEMHEQLSKSLGFPELIPWEPLIKCVDPGCVLLFPGYEIYQGLSGWYLLTCEMNQLLASDYLNGWMSRYHRQRLCANTATVEFLLKQLDGLHNRLTHWKAIFEKNFRIVFIESAVEEWFECNINYKIAKLSKLIRQGNQLIALGDSVFDRSRLEAGDC